VALVPREPMGPQAYVRLPLSVHARARALADEAGVTFSEAVRQLIERGLPEEATRERSETPPELAPNAQVKQYVQSNDAGSKVVLPVVGTGL
jgi:hypothetical protein